MPKRFHLYLFVLIAICFGSILLAIPTINNNIGDPNRIVYFNSDEGGQMDLIWYYYSGQRRESFRWDFDYGLEMVYMADLGRLLFSKFMTITPGTFVLMLRWIHLVAWLLSFIALWRLVGYHFGKGWQQVLPVSLLAVRPSFAYFLNNMKPEPLILLVMITGLDYTLRIVENPLKRRYLYLAAAMAAVAFIIKFAGLFLLPAIVAALYFANRCGKDNDIVAFPTLKISWIMPLLAGLFITVFPLVPILFYVRKSTGCTWYEQFGLWGSLMQNKFVFYIWAVGFVLTILSLLLFLMNKNNGPRVKKSVDLLNELNSHALIACGLAAGFIMLFGFRWFSNPKQFVAIYGQLGPIACKASNAVTAAAQGGMLPLLYRKLNDFDIFISVLLIFYLAAEIYYRRENLEKDRIRLFKRLVLLVFIAPLFVVMFSTFRMEPHNTLPFFAAASILAVQGFYIYRSGIKNSGYLKYLSAAVFGLLLISDILLNGAAMARSRMHQFYQKEDASFETAQWWRENIPRDALVVADHHTAVYIPPEYTNIKTIKDLTDKPGDFKKFVQKVNPELIYYNAQPTDSHPPLDIKEIAPNRNVRLLKSFDSLGRNYQREKGDKFVIYEVVK